MASLRSRRCYPALATTCRAASAAAAGAILVGRDLIKLPATTAFASSGGSHHSVLPSTQGLRGTSVGNLDGARARQAMDHAAATETTGATSSLAPRSSCVFIGLAAGVIGAAAVRRVGSANRSERARCAADSFASDVQFNSGSAVGDSSEGHADFGKLFKQYGPVALVFHTTVFWSSFLATFLIINSGLDLQAVLGRLPESLQNHLPGLTGEAGAIVKLQLALAIVEVLGPARLALTVAAAPVVSGVLRKKDPETNTSLWRQFEATLVLNGRGAFRGGKEIVTNVVETSDVTREIARVGTETWDKMTGQNQKPANGQRSVPVDRLQELHVFNSKVVEDETHSNERVEQLS